MTLLLTLVLGLSVVWGAVSYFISLGRGWHVLQRVMPATEGESPTVSLRFRAVTIGVLTYKNAVVIDIGKSVVLVRQFWPMSILYPPIKVPIAMFQGHLTSEYAGMVTVVERPVKLMVARPILSAVLRLSQAKAAQGVDPGA
jgi:hypothetical protein